MNSINQSDQKQTRVLSIDFFRGITMFILVTGIAQIFDGMLDEGKGGSIIAFLGKQGHHGKWYELYFWDLIQPFFMFIVGIAMPFSLAKRSAKGDSWKKSFHHALLRSFWLLVLGFMLGATATTYSLTNILPQLSFAYIVAFLLMRLDIKWQLLISFGLILITDLLYHFWPVEGYNQLAPGQNFGSWFDMATVGFLNKNHWVTFNAIPTTAHVIWGVLVGKLLMTNWSHNKKVLIMLITGLVAVIIGYALRPFIPIIERISTSTYVIVTGGWALIGMSFSYWLIDVMNFKKFAHFFAIVGMNPIFIYLFTGLGGRRLLSSMATPFTYRFFYWTNDITKEIITTIVVVAMVWFICYFLYKRKIFFKL